MDRYIPRYTNFGFISICSRSFANGENLLRKLAEISTMCNTGPRFKNMVSIFTVWLKRSRSIPTSSLNRRGGPVLVLHV